MRLWIDRGVGTVAERSSDRKPPDIRVVATPDGNVGLTFKCHEVKVCVDIGTDDAWEIAEELKRAVIAITGGHEYNDA